MVAGIIYRTFACEITAAILVFQDKRILVRSFGEVRQ